jgi:predicted nucleic acid-binding protein
VVLVDSSFWIRIEHGTAMLDDYIPEDEDVATCPVVMFEVLRGTRDEGRYFAALQLLLDADMLDSPTPLARFEEAARIYLKCRDAGVTPSAGDCLIAACAIIHRVPLLHFDADFDLIARVIPTLKIFTRS